jgi:MFS family permease
LPPKVEQSAFCHNRADDAARPAVPSVSSQSPSPRAFSALQHPNFARFLWARFLSTLAVQMQSVAVGWQVYALTGDPKDLGFIGLAQFLPFVALVLPAGHVADRFDRRRILALCYATEVVCGLLLLGFTLSGLQAVWPVFGVMLLFGAARAFSMPTSQAITPNLVPVERLGNAVTLNSSTFHVATIAGPTLGGLVYLLGPATVYSVVAIVLSISVLLMSGVHVPQVPPREERVGWHSLLEGLRFVRSREVVLGAILLDLFAVLFGGATALLPAYARDVLHVGPTGLGLLRTAPGAGAAICAILIAFVPITRHVGRWMFGGVALFGATTVVFGASTIFAISLLALFLAGAGDMVSVYIRHLLVQLDTPDAIRGRVSAVNAIFIGASNELGEFESGITAAWWGVVRSVLIGGAATLAVTLLWTRIFPTLWKMDRFPEPAR